MDLKINFFTHKARLAKQGGDFNLNVTKFDPTIHIVAGERKPRLLADINEGLKLLISLPFFRVPNIIKPGKGVRVL